MLYFDTVPIETQMWNIIMRYSKNNTVHFQAHTTATKL